MQNTELFRRGVVLPLNDAAEELLRVNDVSEDTPVLYIEIAEESFFEELWSIGIFRRINEKTNGLIDDYEEHFVDSLESIIAATNETISEEILSSESRKFLLALSSLAAEAKTLNRSVLFVL